MGTWYGLIAGAASLALTLAALHRLGRGVEISRRAHVEVWAPMLMGALDGTVSMLGVIWFSSFEEGLWRAWTIGVVGAATAAHSMGVAEWTHDAGKRTGRGRPTTRAGAIVVGTLVAVLLPTMGFLLPYPAAARVASSVLLAFQIGVIAEARLRLDGVPWPMTFVQVGVLGCAINVAIGVIAGAVF